MCYDSTGMAVHLIEGIKKISVVDSGFFGEEDSGSICKGIDEEGFDLLRQAQQIIAHFGFEGVTRFYKDAESWIEHYEEYFESHLR